MTTQQVLAAVWHWGANHQILLIVSGGLASDWVLGRSKDPRLRSVASLISTALQSLLTKVGVGRMPIAGPLLIGLVGVMKTGDKPAPPTEPQPPAPPAP